MEREIERSVVNVATDSCDLLTGMNASEQAPAEKWVLSSSSWSLGFNEFWTREMPGK